MAPTRFGDVNRNGLTPQQGSGMDAALAAAGYTDSKTVVQQINSGLRAAASSSNNNSSGGGGNILTNTATTLLGTLYDRYYYEAYRLGKERVAEFIKVISSAGANITTGNIMTAVSGLIKNVLLQNIEDVAKTAEEINDKILKTINANSMFVGDLSETMREEMRDTIPLAQMMGVQVEDFLNGAESLFKAQGRMITYSQDTLQYAVTVGKAYTENATDIMNNVDNFRNVGIGLSDASKNIERIGKSSAALGLNAKESTKTVMANLDKLNQYGFKNGIEGLSKMVLQAQALKINMDSVFKIADKVFDPEGAIELTAGLQAIGGAFGDLADPMKAMYDSTNNMEGLQDAFIKSASSLAVLNEEQGRFEVTGANLRKAKAMADLYGVSLTEVTNAATKGAAKIEAMSQMQMFSNLNEQQQEFVSNMAQMKDGKIGIEVPKTMMEQLGLKESFVQLTDLNENQVAQLKKYQEDIAGMSTEDIALGTMNNTTNMANVLTAIQRGLENRFFKSAPNQAMQKAQASMSRGLRQYGPGKSGDILKKGSAVYEDLMKEIGGIELPEGPIKDAKDAFINKVKSFFPDEIKNRNIPNDMIVPNPITSRLSSPSRVDVYFHAGSSAVDPFLRSLEMDPNMRGAFTRAFQTPDYLQPQQANQ